MTLRAGCSGRLMDPSCPLGALHRVNRNDESGRAVDITVTKSVLVCFHAHPDDEVFTTGGVMRLAADAGHRVVLVTATDGALGRCRRGCWPRAISSSTGAAASWRPRPAHLECTGWRCSVMRTRGWPAPPTTRGPTRSATWASRSPPHGWQRCWSRRAPTCSPFTTRMATTGIPTTSRKGLLPGSRATLIGSAPATAEGLLAEGGLDLL